MRLGEKEQYGRIKENTNTIYSNTNFIRIILFNITDRIINEIRTNRNTRKK